MQSSGRSKWLPSIKTVIALTNTHDMMSVRAIADKVAMLHDGVIQWTSPIAQMDDSGDSHIDQFIHGHAEGPIEAVR